MRPVRPVSPLYHSKDHFVLPASSLAAHKSFVTLAADASNPLYSTWAFIVFASGNELQPRPRSRRQSINFGTVRTLCMQIGGRVICLPTSFQREQLGLFGTDCEGNGTPAHNLGVQLRDERSHAPLPTKLEG